MSRASHRRRRRGTPERANRSVRVTVRRVVEPNIDKICDELVRLSRPSVIERGEKMNKKFSNIPVEDLLKPFTV